MFVSFRIRDGDDKSSFTSVSKQMKGDCIAPQPVDGELYNPRGWQSYPNEDKTASPDT
jgi:hypothetical protein